jgi:predicted RNA-binding Zn-ribbon protein involved in translation (DUF1610 family)
LYQFNQGEDLTMVMQQQSLECPKCGKHTLVQRSNDVYVCLACDFKKDFAAPPPKKSPDLGGFLFAGIIAGFAILLLGALRPDTSTNPNPAIQPGASKTPFVRP